MKGIHYLYLYIFVNTMKFY